MKLPDALMEAWEPDTQAKLGGIMQIAGIDPVEQFSSKKIKDHPWLNLQVKFPFPEVGNGIIRECIIHPLGRLMFDVFFPNPVPPIHGYGERYEVVLKDRPEHHQQWHRFFAEELKFLCEVI